MNAGFYDWIAGINDMKFMAGRLMQAQYEREMAFYQWTTKVNRDKLDALPFSEDDAIKIAHGKNTIAVVARYVTLEGYSILQVIHQYDAEKWEAGSGLPFRHDLSIA